MTITSKFDRHQRIFWLENNKVRSATVRHMQFPLVQWTKDGQMRIEDIMYFVSITRRSDVINWNGGGLRESQCFASKADLLKSL